MTIFQTVLGDQITAEALLNTIEKTEVDFNDILKNNECLLGILLGFGTYNASLFEQRERLEKELASKVCLKSSSTASLRDKIKGLWEILNQKNEMEAQGLLMANQVIFVGDSTHRETIDLKRKYMKQSAELSVILSKDSWFEDILEQLQK